MLPSTLQKKSNSKFQKPNSKFQEPNPKPPTTKKNKNQIPKTKLPTTDSYPQTLNFKP